MGGKARTSKLSYRIAGLQIALSLFGAFIVTVNLFAHTELVDRSHSQLQHHVTRADFEPVAVRQASDYAYAFVIGGVDPAKPAYRGFLYSILVSRRILLEQGSTADAVLMVQMSGNGTSQLPSEEVRVLHALRIQIRYIPSPKRATFADTVMSKFRILTLNEYRRVMFLDADVMPLGNLDYFFELSDGPAAILQKSVVIKGVSEPAHGGFFLLSPEPGDWDQISALIEEKRRQKFNVTIGWGHLLKGYDEWFTRRSPLMQQRSGDKWDFNGAKVDQVYYWVRYVKQNSSFVAWKNVYNYGIAPKDGRLKMVRHLRDPFAPYSQPLIDVPESCGKFICDFFHFTGRQKPWVDWKAPPPPSSNASASVQLWWKTLQELDQSLQMKIPFGDAATFGQPPPLGYFAKKRDR